MQCYWENDKKSNYSNHPTKQACTDIDGRSRKARRLWVVRVKQRFETEALLHARQNAHTRSTKGFSHLQLLMCACHLVALSGLIWLIPKTQRLSLLRFFFHSNHIWAIYFLSMFSPIMSLLFGDKYSSYTKLHFPKCKYCILLILDTNCWLKTWPTTIS